MAESPLQLILTPRPADPPDTDEPAQPCDDPVVAAVGYAVRCIAMVSRPTPIRAEEARQLLRDHLEANADHDVDAP